MTQNEIAAKVIGISIEFNKRLGPGLLVSDFKLDLLIEELVIIENKTRIINYNTKLLEEKNHRVVNNF